MQNGSVVLVGTSLVAVGSNVTTAVGWNGGQGVLVIQATQFAPIVNLMLVGPSALGTRIKVNSSAILADVVMPLMLPAGRYEVHSATGTSIGLYASLCPTP